MIVSSSAKYPAASLAALLLAVAAFSWSSSFSFRSALAQEVDSEGANLFPVVPEDSSLFEEGVCAANSRWFRANITKVCSGGSYGYEFAYGFGAERGDVVVTSCPDDCVLTFRTVGGTASSTPFAEDDIAFLEKTANDIEADPIDDLEEPGAVEALSVLSSRTLAAWPSDQFPIDVTCTSLDDASSSVTVPIVQGIRNLAMPACVVDGGK